MNNYELYNQEELILSFTHNETLIGDIYTNLKIHNKDLLPLRLKQSCTELHLKDWIERRSVPVNRHHMIAVLDKLNLKKPFDLMKYAHALSLNDNFWLKSSLENLSFKDINLYDNKFDMALGWIAYTGLPSDISRNLSTPELTTVGVLPKYWQRIGKDDIILCKGGTSGYSNAGYEPYHEIVSYIVAKIIGVNTIPYKLGFRNSKIVSISKLFTSKQYGLITIDDYLDYCYPNVKSKDIKALLNAFKEDDIDDYPFYQMCFFDYIIENFDRHRNNWGLMIENKTQKFVGYSPLWDNGMSLDYEKPKEMRKQFDFASFDIKYDFIFDCKYTDNFNSLANKLLVNIRSKNLEQQIYNEVVGYYPNKLLTTNTILFIQKKCEDFLLNTSKYKRKFMHLDI